ncbi:MAG: histidine phosphatase family protein [bacterium]|nr:histidine phosphatase family protein [bacterium]
MRYLYLVRHGYYDYNDERDPDVGKALVPLGVAQSRLLADRLQSLPHPFTAFYSSTMTRARETAYVIDEDMPELELIETERLRECIPPTWREDVMAEDEASEVEACQEQLEEAFAHFFVPSKNGDERDLIVAHGNVIRYFVARALGVDPLAWLGMSVGNCSVTVIRVNADNTFKVLAVGDVGHLPPNMQTGWDATDHSLAVPQR